MEENLLQQLMTFMTANKTINILVFTHSLETPKTKDETAMLVPETTEIIKILLFKGAIMAAMTSGENQQ